MGAISQVSMYGQIEKIVQQDDGTILVHGIASSESIDTAGEVIRAEAIRAAIPGYMQYPALREMHQLSAAGSTLEATVGDDGITRVVAHVTDEAAIKKVKLKTYRGFSIGGKVTKRNPDDRKIIEGITLSEISLVDRPCNPDAVLECWKADGASVVDEIEVNIIDPNDGEEVSKRDFDAKQRRADAKSGKAMPDGSFPIADKEDLHNAIRLAGKAKNPAAARAHIKRRAAALGASDMIPSDWKDGAKKADAAGDVQKTIEPLELHPTSIDQILGNTGGSNGEGMDATAVGAAIAGKHVEVTLPGNGPEKKQEVKNPEEAGQAHPDPLNESAVDAVEHMEGETPKPGTDSRTRKQPDGAAPKATKTRNATQDTSDKAADGDMGKDKTKSAKPKDGKGEPVIEDDTQDTADKDKKKDAKKAADDPVANARAAADAALKAATAVLNRLSRQENGGISPVLAAGAELRKGLHATARVGCLLVELAYCLSEAQFEKSMEGDDSAVPEKLHAAVESLGAAYKAMSDEELQELLDAADKTMSAQIALAAASGDLAKAFDGVAHEGAVAGLVSGAEHDALEKAEDRITALEDERDDLLKTVGGLTETLDTLSKRVQQLADTPMPAKTITKAADPALVSVSKEQDASGSTRISEMAKAAVPTEDEVRQALAAMSEDERTMLIMKASLSPINARPISR